MLLHKLWVKTHFLPNKNVFRSKNPIFTPKNLTFFSHFFMLFDIFQHCRSFLSIYLKPWMYKTIQDVARYWKIIKSACFLKSRKQKNIMRKCRLCTTLVNFSFEAIQKLLEGYKTARWPEIFSGDKIAFPSSRGF